MRGQHGTRYADVTQEPLFPFGHGLSYTQYRYSNPRLPSTTLVRGQAARVSVDADGRSVVEPGDFDIMVGPSSRDRDLLKVTLRAE